MGKVAKKKNLKTVKPVPKKNNSVCCKNKRRSKTFSHNNTVKQRMITRGNVNSITNSKCQELPIASSNLNFNTEVIEIKDNSSLNDFSKETNAPNNVNDITIIDITDISDKVYNYQTIPCKIKAQHIECDNIINITDTTFEDTINVITQSESSIITSNKSNDCIIDITETTFEKNLNEIETQSKTSESSTIEKNLKEIETQSKTSESSTIEYVSCNDVKIISCTTSIENKPNDLIIISDGSDDSDDSSNDSDVSNHITIQQPKQFISIKEYHSSSIHPTNTLKRKYNSPLHNRKKESVDENKFRPNLGAFVIDKQRIPNHSQNHKRFKSGVAATNQELKPSSSNITMVANRKLRPIIIDGLNIGHKHGGGTFSAKGIELCIEYFSKRGHKDILAFIPEHRQGPPGSDSNIILNKLDKKGHICFTPSRKVQNLRMTCYDDRILLNYAYKCGGVVVSNDYYRDLYNESEEFKDIIENRQVMVTFARNEILVPEDQYNRKNDVRSLSDILAFPA